MILVADFIGLPKPLTNSELKKSLAGAAKATVSSRHQGPRKDMRDSLQKLTDEASNDVRTVNFSETTMQNPSESSSSARNDSDDLRISPTEAYADRHPERRKQKTPEGYDPEKPYYESRTLFQKFCRRCPWKSHPTYDASGLQGLVAELEFHVKDVHGGDGDSSSQRGLTEREEFKLATTARLIKESKDDRNNLFCEGRFLMGPLNWRSCDRQAPLSHEVYPHIDLWHIGTPTAHRKTISWMHDRANRNIIKLDLFSDANLGRVIEKKKYSVGPGEVTVGAVDIELGATNTKDGTIDNSRATKEAIMAVHNFVQIRRFLHPTDIGRNHPNQD